MDSFSSKINIRLMVIHFVAFWLFIYGFRTLSYLYDFDFMIFSPIENRANDVGRVNLDKKIVALAALLGAITAYVISWRISLKRNWFWVNSAFIFVLIYVLKLNDLLLWSKLQAVFLKPGSIFRLTTRTFYVVNGAIMLAIGSFLLFSGKVQRFIDRKKAAAAAGANDKVKPAKAK